MLQIHGVPISDGGFTLADSTAICDYLDRTHPAAPLYPADPQGHARALWLEQYAGGTVFHDVVHPLFSEVFVQPQVYKIAANQSRIDAVLGTTLPEVFGYLESVAKQPFFVGARMSMADVAVVSNLITLQYIGFALDELAAPLIPAGSLLGISELPAVERMAVCVRIGPPEDAHLVTAKVGQFLEQNGDDLAGAGREAFLQLPAPDRMHDAVVEMQFPVIRATFAR